MLVDVVVGGVSSESDISIGDGRPDKSLSTQGGISSGRLHSRISSAVLAVYSQYEAPGVDVLAIKGCASCLRECAMVAPQRAGHARHKEDSERGCCACHSCSTSGPARLHLVQGRMWSGECYGGGELLSESGVPLNPSALPKSWHT